MVRNNLCRIRMYIEPRDLLDMTCEEQLGFSSSLMKHQCLFAHMSEYTRERIDAQLNLVPIKNCSMFCYGRGSFEQFFMLRLL